MKKVKRNFLLVILLLLFVSGKSDSEENISTRDEKEAIKANDNSELIDNVQDAKSDENECPCIESEEKNENSKLEKPLNSVDKSQVSNSEDTKESEEVADPKQTNENTKECNQQSGNQDSKSEELKSKDSDNLPVAVDDSKQQKTKEDDKNKKTSLSDVNAQVEDSDQAKTKKRETYSDSPSYALGLPRDASYFFDDLEPFINNSSDFGRIGRAAPSRPVQVNIFADNGVTNYYIFYLDKNQKSRLKGKGKEIMEDDVDDDEEEERNEEDEKQDEDDYDEDEDVDSDCKPTTGCPTTTPKCTTTCPTTRCPTTTTTCPTTPKCTTKHRCPTTCKKTTQCPTTTKCPRVCGNGADDNLETDMEKESDKSCDSNNKKHRQGKRRFHHKEIDG